MNKFLKFTLISAVIVVMLSIVFGVVKATLGNYFSVNPFNGVFMLLGAAIAIYFGFKFIKKIAVFAILGVLLVAQGCNYAKSNQQVLVSTDCGMNWEQVEAGDAVPKGGVNPCYMKVVIPNHPMQGQSSFICNLKDRVRASVHIDYDYSITKPLSFIKQAKYLGSANADADSEDALNTNQFESAENSVIDTRLRDVSKGILLNEDIVEMDQADMEVLIQKKCNEVLEEFGVYLNFITLTFDLDEQTRQAIDVSTAMKIYQSKALEELGKAVMTQKAGATKVIVNAQSTNQEAKTEE
jgi:hypothetical protein